MARVRGWSRSRNLHPPPEFARCDSRLIEHKILNFTAIIAIAHFIEQVFAEPRTFDGFQKLFGNDHIRVDIDHVQRRSHGIELVNFSMFFSFSDASGVFEIANICKATGHGGSRGHGRRHKMRTSTAPLSAFKITVGG